MVNQIEVKQTGKRQQTVEVAYTPSLYIYIYIKGLRPLPPTPVERMDRGSLNRTSATELPAPTEKQCGRFKLDVQRQRQYFCER